MATRTPTKTKMIATATVGTLMTATLTYEKETKTYIKYIINDPDGAGMLATVYVSKDKTHLGNGGLEAPAMVTLTLKSA